VGNGYPVAGIYSGINNRTITMVGDRKSAKQRLYHGRDTALGGNTSKVEEMEKMDMPHYMGKTGRFGKDHTCMTELYNQTRFEVTFD